MMFIVILVVFTASDKSILCKVNLFGKSLDGDINIQGQNLERVNTFRHLGATFA